MQSTIPSTSTQPQPQPPPSASTFSWSRIGQQPSLLSRISAPDGSALSFAPIADSEEPESPRTATPPVRDQATVGDRVGGRPNPFGSLLDEMRRPSLTPEVSQQARNGGAAVAASVAPVQSTAAALPTPPSTSSLTSTISPPVITAPQATTRLATPAPQKTEPEADVPLLAPMATDTSTPDQQHHQLIDAFNDRVQATLTSLDNDIQVSQAQSSHSAPNRSAAHSTSPSRDSLVSLVEANQAIASKTSEEASATVQLARQSLASAQAALDAITHLTSSTTSLVTSSSSIQSSLSTHGTDLLTRSTQHRQSLVDLRTWVEAQLFDLQEQSTTLHHENTLLKSQNSRLKQEKTELEARLKSEQVLRQSESQRRQQLEAYITAQHAQHDAQRERDVLEASAESARQAAEAERVKIAEEKRVRAERVEREQREAQARAEAEWREQRRQQRAQEQARQQQEEESRRLAQEEEAKRQEEVRRVEAEKKKRLEEEKAREREAIEHQRRVEEQARKRDEIQRAKAVAQFEEAERIREAQRLASLSTSASGPSPAAQSPSQTQTQFQPNPTSPPLNASHSYNRSEEDEDDGEDELDSDEEVKSLIPALIPSPRSSTSSGISPDAVGAPNDADGVIVTLSGQSSLPADATEHNLKALNRLRGSRAQSGVGSPVVKAEPDGPTSPPTGARTSLTRELTPEPDFEPTGSLQNPSHFAEQTHTQTQPQNHHTHTRTPPQRVEQLKQAFSSTVVVPSPPRVRHDANGRAWLDTGSGSQRISPTASTIPPTSAAQGQAGSQPHSSSAMANSNAKPKSTQGSAGSSVGSEPQRRPATKILAPQANTGLPPKPIFAYRKDSGGGPSQGAVGLGPHTQALQDARARASSASGGFGEEARAVERMREQNQRTQQQQQQPAHSPQSQYQQSVPGRSDSRLPEASYREPRPAASTEAGYADHAHGLKYHGDPRHAPASNQAPRRMPTSTSNHAPTFDEPVSRSQIVTSASAPLHSASYDRSWQERTVPAPSSSTGLSYNPKKRARSPEEPFGSGADRRQRREPPPSDHTHTQFQSQTKHRAPPREMDTYIPPDSPHRQREYDRDYDHGREYDRDRDVQHWDRGRPPPPPPPPMSSYDDKHRQNRHRNMTGPRYGGERESFSPEDDMHRTGGGGAGGGRGSAGPSQPQMRGPRTPSYEPSSLSPSPSPEPGPENEHDHGLRTGNEEYTGMEDQSNTLAFQLRDVQNSVADSQVHQGSYRSTSYSTSSHGSHASRGQKNAPRNVPLQQRFTEEYHSGHHTNNNGSGGGRGKGNQSNRGRGDSTQSNRSRGGRALPNPSQGHSSNAHHNEGGETKRGRAGAPRGGKSLVNRIETSPPNKQKASLSLQERLTSGRS